MSQSSSAAATLRSYVVIPARYASTRLPRKMLLRETGKTLLQHTYEAACAARKPAGVLVATDHAEIAREVESFRGDFVMTSPACASGTDRVAEVARKLPRADVLVNVQGDEPEMSPENIDRVIELLEQNPSAGMATLATRLPSPEQLTNPACVKVVFDNAGPSALFQPEPDSVCSRSGTGPAVQRADVVLSALGDLRVSTKRTAGGFRAAAVVAGASGKAGATSHVAIGRNDLGGSRGARVERD